MCSGRALMWTKRAMGESAHYLAPNQVNLCFDLSFGDCEVSEGDDDDRYGDVEHFEHGVGC